MEIELNELDVRYQTLRIHEREREARLMASLAGGGQQVPIVVLPAQPAYILLDGYKRMRCAKRLGWTALAALCWDLEEAEALIFCSMLRGGDKDSALEQGWLLRELQGRFGLKLDELGRRFDRSQSWVSRRLGLVRDLPELAQEAVQSGKIVAHGAMKYLVPLARANRKDCLRLSEAISALTLSSRQIGRLYQGYVSGTERTRELVLGDPALYLKVEEEATEAVVKKKRTPAEELISDLRILGAVSRRADHRLRGGVCASLSREQRDLSGRLMVRVQADVEGLVMTWRKELDDGGRGCAHGDFQAQGKGREHPWNREGAEGLPEDGPRGPKKRDDTGTGDRPAGDCGAV